MAESLIEQSLRRASRPCHVLLLGDIDQAAQWKHFALRKRNQLLATGRDMPMSQVLQPDENTTIRILTGPVVDIVRIEVGGGSGVILRANVGNATQEKLLLTGYKPGEKVALKHPDKKITQGGNLDWTSTNRKTVLSFDGPLGRAVPPAIVTIAGDFSFGDLSAYSVTYVKSLTSITNVFGDTWYLVCQRFGRSVYKDGAVFAEAPIATSQGTWPYVILGAAQLTYQANGVTKTYLVAALTRAAREVGVLYRDSGNQQRFYSPECVDHVIAWAEVSTDPIGPNDWEILHTEALSADPRLMPATGAYFFSGSGKQFASLVPVISGPASRIPGNDDHALIRGTLTATAQGVSLDSFTVTYQAASGHYDFSGDYEFEYPPLPGYPGGVDEYWTVVGFNDRQVNVQSQAIVAVDFVGDTEITLTGELSQQVSFREDWNVFSDLQGYTSGGMNQTQIRQKTLSEIETLTASVTDTHRSLNIGNAHLTRSDTRAIGVDISTATGEALYEQFSQVDQRATLTVSRPLFYDLRTGAAVYADMSYSLHYSSQMDESGQIGAFGVADGGIRTDGWSDQKSFVITIKDTDRFPHDTWNWQDQTGDTSTSETIITSEDHWLDVGGLPPINASGNQLEHSASSTHSIPWVRYPETDQPDRHAPLTLHCQSANLDGDVVARGHYSANFEWAEANTTTMPSFYHDLNHAFASHCDLDQKWQAHIDKSHSTAPSNTAVEADITPLFRY